MNSLRIRQNLRTGKNATRRRKSVSRDKFIAIICGYGSNVNSKSMVEGLHVYTDYIEKSITDLFDNQASIDALQTIIGHSDSQNDRIDQLLDMCVTLSENLQNLTSHTSFDHLLTAMLAHYQIADEVSEEQRDVMLKIVSACVGWISMLYIRPQITLQTEPGLVRLMTSQNASGRQRGTGDASHRSIGALLRNSSLIPIACGTPPSMTNIHLTTANINFYSLHKLGGISVQWVDEIAQHCSFNKRNKTINIFRFPSRCLALCARGNENVAFQRYGKPYGG